MPVLLSLDRLGAESSCGAGQARSQQGKDRTFAKQNQEIVRGVDVQQDLPTWNVSE